MEGRSRRARRRRRRREGEEGETALASPSPSFSPFLLDLRTWKGKRAKKVFFPSFLEGRRRRCYIGEEGEEKKRGLLLLLLLLLLLFPPPTAMGSNRPRGEKGEEGKKSAAASQLAAKVERGGGGGEIPDGFQGRRLLPLPPLSSFLGGSRGRGGRRGVKRLRSFFPKSTEEEKWMEEEEGGV